jgi:hypothetical protein
MVCHLFVGSRGPTLPEGRETSREGAPAISLTGKIGADTALFGGFREITRDAVANVRRPRRPFAIVSIPFRPRIAQRLSNAALAFAIALALASCNRPQPPAPADATTAQPPTSSRFVAPQDVFERDARAIVGISYPTGLDRYPALANVLVAHAQERRAALAAALDHAPQVMVPFELTLRFSTVADAPRMFAVTADEELYTGGAASRPAHAVFLWLPAENRLLSPDEMIPEPASWSRLDEDIRQLRREESASLATPANGRAMQHVFVPRFNSAGRIAGLRFRTDDGDEVELPGSVLRPLVAPAYATWFEDAPAVEGNASTPGAASEAAPTP